MSPPMINGVGQRGIWILDTVEFSDTILPVTCCDSGLSRSLSQQTITQVDPFEACLSVVGVGHTHFIITFAAIFNSVGVAFLVSFFYFSTFFFFLSISSFFCCPNTRSASSPPSAPSSSSSSITSSSSSPWFCFLRRLLSRPVA